MRLQEFFFFLSVLNLHEKEQIIEVLLQFWVNIYSELIFLEFFLEFYRTNKFGFILKFSITKKYTTKKKHTFTFKKV